jgi:hypothetical protein
MIRRPRWLGTVKSGLFVSRLTEKTEQRGAVGVADGIRTRGLQGHNLALYPS